MESVSSPVNETHPMENFWPKQKMGQCLDRAVYCQASNPLIAERRRELFLLSALRDAISGTIATG